MSAMQSAERDTRAPEAGAPETRESLAGLLGDLELRTTDDFRAVAEPALWSARVAGESGWYDLQKRAELVTGDVLGRLGRLADMGRIAKAVNQWSEEHRDRYLLARSHRLLAVFFRQLGDPAEALGHAVQAVEYADGMPPLIRTGHLVTLAMVLDVNGSFDAAHRRFTEALEIATEHDYPPGILTALNNMTYTACENGDVATANHLAGQMRPYIGRPGVHFDALYFDTLARVSMLQGRYAEAEEILRPVLDNPTGPLVTEADALPECLLTVAEAQLLAGRPGQAQQSLAQAERLATERGLAAVTARVHQARAELFAATEHYREAYHEYRQFHAATESLHSAQREVRAHAMQAVFETAEARQATEEFRQLAFRDALTGLYNRRYIDEQLDAMVRQATLDGTALSVALIDLDHFKRVNDTHSHKVGDQVLQQVAALLVAGVREPALAARLGGEEFVLLLPGTGAEEAAAHCTAVAEAVRRYPWRPLTGTLPVTASIGVTTWTGGATSPGALLSSADRHLYAAKHAGRDRVVHDRTPPG